MRILKYILVVPFFIIIACEFRNKAVSKTTEGSLRSNDILTEWKKDSLGCAWLRNDTTAKILVDSLNLKNQYPSAIVKLLGKPNENMRKGSSLAILYYYHSFCENQRLINNEPQCWFGFIFKDSTVNSCTTTAHCQ